MTLSKSNILRRSSSDVIKESITFIEEINTKEQNLEKMGEAINSSIKEMNKVIDWVTHSIIEPRQQDLTERKETEKHKYLREYFLFYIVTYATVGSAFGYLSFPNIDWSNIIKLGLVLSSAILIGAIKDILWNTVQSKTKQIESLTTRAKALETALASQSIHTTKTNIKFNKLILYIRETYPDADIENILYAVDAQVPHKVEKLKSYQVMCDEIETALKEDEKKFTSTIKF